MDEETNGEYTRLRMQVQRGDGPDRRGKVEVEMQREHPEARAERDAVSVELPDGTTAGTQVHHETFSEFVFETDRAVDLLEERLGLDAEGGE